MSRSVSFTIHPAALGAEYLSVTDAMKQILDLVEALEHTEAAGSADRQIVWRLTDAHTNSPPLTITAEAFSISPAIAIDIEASRVVKRFTHGITELLHGRSDPELPRHVIAPLKRIFQRNLTGIGLTEVSVEGEQPLTVAPSGARSAIIAVERLELDWKADIQDYRRTEYGAVEVEVFGITRFYDKPALIVTERLSREKVTCILSSQLADFLGPNHQWNEAWQGERLLVSGALHYNEAGSLARIEAEDAEPLPWTSVALGDLRDIDLTRGRSVQEHLNLIRGEDVG
jgi:hypothetical protein